MQNAIAIVEAASNGGLIALNDKGKAGTFARAIAFASRDTRIQLGQLMHLRWLQNGQYRPLVDDILTCGIVPKAALPFVVGLVPTMGPVRKESLLSLCTAVANFADNSRTKDGARREFKGEKAFVLELVRRIAADATQETVEA
jgi:hypothetical protein